MARRRVDTQSMPPSGSLSMTQERTPEFFVDHK
jgi:hypothetical protein